MKICRFNGDRLGIVEDSLVYDVSAALAVLPEVSWPVPMGDLLITHIDKVLDAAKPLLPTAPSFALSSVKLMSPVANPSKIVAAPVNYRLHIEEGKRDADLHQNRPVLTIDLAGPFLKAVSSLAGPDEGVELCLPDARHDYEVELAVVIGKAGRNIPRAAALSHVAGYTIGIDMSVRGTWDRSARKSCDTFSVLGPWLVTADEILDPNALDIALEVNGVTRQQSNTSFLIFDVERCIEFFSTFYTLLPGDVIMTGTPEGVGPVSGGDIMTARIARIGQMAVAVREPVSHIS